MNNLVRRTTAMTFIVLASSPFVYLALAIRAFKENPVVVAPCYQGLVDCLDTPAGRPLELLMKANGVTVEYLHCAQYEADLADGCAATNRHLDAKSNCLCPPFIAVTNRDEVHEISQVRPGFPHETN